VRPDCLLDGRPKVERLLESTLQLVGEIHAAGD
jgi:hypothetical protein